MPNSYDTCPETPGVKTNADGSFHSRTNLVRRAPDPATEKRQMLATCREGRNSLVLLVGLLVPHLAEHAWCRPLLVQALATGLNPGVVGPLVLVQGGEEGPGAAAAADCG